MQCWGQRAISIQGYVYTAPVLRKKYASEAKHGIAPSLICIINEQLPFAQEASVQKGAVYMAPSCAKPLLLRKSRSS